MSSAVGESTAPMDPRYYVPSQQIPRLHYPSQIGPERFEREFAAQSKPCIIYGLLDDWPAHADKSRSWRGDRWDKHMADTMVDVSFDPRDNRIMHFGDDEGEPGTMFNPGRLKMPAWAFLEIGRIRQYILQTRRASGEHFCWKDHEDLKQRLNRELEVQNIPFVEIDESSPLHLFTPVRCRIRDLVPFAFYMSGDTYMLPKSLQEDLVPLAPKLIPAWCSPNSSRIWVASGANWKVPYPPWGDNSVPEPAGDQRTYSCFHCDRMENFHSMIAGEKEVVLVPPGKHDVLKATRFSMQAQWLLAPVSGHGKTYLGSTLMYSNTVMDFQSDQSAVHPLRSPEANRQVSNQAWPDQVDFPISVGRLQKGDTLYIPAYHWHWVATATPPVLEQFEDGPLAMSVNFWWWPIHNDSKMEEWSWQNELTSWKNRRVDMPQRESPDRSNHAVMFYQLTAKMREQAAESKPWPSSGAEMEFEVVDHVPTGKLWLSQDLAPEGIDPAMVFEVVD